MDQLIRPGQVVRNKHYPHIVYCTLASNIRHYGLVAPTGYLGYGDASSSAHWEKAPAIDWWRIAIRWYFLNLLWCLKYKMNKDLGLIGRELPPPQQDKHYQNLNYFIYRAELLFGILSEEYL